MADRVFLDTVGLVALLNRDDYYHEEASVVFRSFGEAGRRLVTTELILGELGNTLARTPLRGEAGWLIDQLHVDPCVEVVYADRDLLREGVELYVSRTDKTWGLVDCVSFVVMTKLSIVDAFTADHHFRQAGMNCLLSPVPSP
jgi:hypothetical protein